jgi:translation initiation factor 6 (eIF-6)
MKLTKSQLINIIKEELDLYASTEQYDAPKYRINDRLVTAATNAVVQEAISIMKESNLSQKEMQKIASFIDVDIEEGLMDALMPVASKLDYAQDGELDEKTLTKPETKEKERLVKGMKKDAGGFEERYPGRGEEVMYATATKLAKKRK